MNITTARSYAESEQYIARAAHTIPRAINSHGRQRKNKIAFARSEGSKLWDVDGNEYIDTVMGLGPILFGHNEPTVNAAVTAQMSQLDLMAGECVLEAELAERVCSWVPCAEQVLFSVSGSEAVQAALRIARATTGRSMVVKFEGHYHGWLDPMFTNANGAESGDTGDVRYRLSANSGGQHVTDDMLAVTRFNDKNAFDQLMSQIGHRVAAVIVEPVPFNFGSFTPDPGYLEHIRHIAHRYGALLIFDEVVSGFRLARGGAQELLGVIPDIATFAKAMASGFPISMVAGTRAAMQSASIGSVRHAGTYNAAPLSLAAALATTDLIAENDAQVYRTLESLGARMQIGLESVAAHRGLPLRVNRVGSVSQLFWNAAGSCTSYDSCRTSDLAMVADIAEAMADHGVYTAPRGLMFIGARHTDDDIDQIVAAFDSAVTDILPS